MLAVTEQDSRWILEDDQTQAKAVIIPQRGGILLSWSIGETEIFYLDRERFANPELSIRGGIPLLFPICGNLVDDTYTWKDKTYKLPQHGFARNMPWQVTDQSTLYVASLTVSLFSNDQTLAVYPFPFRLDYIYRLGGNSIEILCRHTNLGTEWMPFATGIHPYFAVRDADKPQLSFKLPAQSYVAKGETTPQPFNGTFDFEQDEIDVALTNLYDRVAKVTDRARNLELTITYDSYYTHLIFWAVKGKDFYCLEPWTAPRNAMNSGDCLLTIAPGETVETYISMGVDFL